MHQCIDCGVELTLENAWRSHKHPNKDGQYYLMNRCKQHHYQRNQESRVLRKQHPPPPFESPCQCCGRKAVLVVDHDHTTGEFRGHICQRCNKGIGKLGDSVEGLMNAALYLLMCDLKHR